MEAMLKRSAEPSHPREFALSPDIWGAADGGETIPRFHNPEIIPRHCGSAGGSEGHAGARRHQWRGQVVPWRMIFHGERRHHETSSQPTANVAPAAMIAAVRASPGASSR